MGKPSNRVNDGRKERKKEEECLPYGNMITKILAETWFNFGDEKYKEYTTKTGNSVLPLMGFEIINGKFTKTHSSNEQKRKANSLETPIEIDNFD